MAAGGATGGSGSDVRHAVAEPHDDDGISDDAFGEMAEKEPEYFDTPTRVGNLDDFEDDEDDEDVTTAGEAESAAEEQSAEESEPEGVGEYAHQLKR